MKLTQNIIALLSDLRGIEGANHNSLLDADGLVLRKNLLALYRRTENPDSHDLIIQIMAQGGYPWLGRLAVGAGDYSRQESAKYCDVESSLLLSEDEFLDLLPANGLFH